MKDYKIVRATDGAIRVERKVRMWIRETAESVEILSDAGYYMSASKKSVILSAPTGTLVMTDSGLEYTANV